MHVRTLVRPPPSGLFVVGVSVLRLLLCWVVIDVGGAHAVGVCLFVVTLRGDFNFFKRVLWCAAGVFFLVRVVCWVAAAMLLLPICYAAGCAAAKFSELLLVL